VAGQVSGLTLIGLGVATIVLALVRFRKTENDSPQQLPGSGGRVDIVLATLLVILGTALFVFFSYAVATNF
jgi:uncharacterized membrane protein YidH (DUF202 family)